MVSIRQSYTFLAYALLAGHIHSPAEAFSLTRRRNNPPRFRQDLLTIEKDTSTQSILHSSVDENVQQDSSTNTLFPERLNIIFDSKCSVCQWEVENLTYLMSKLPPAADGHPLLRFTDLESSDGYDESDPANGGVTYEDGMRSFHAVRSDGTTLKGVSVFKEAYDIVNFGWVWAWTGTPWLRKLADWGYKFFARIRTDVTRGSKVEDLIEKHYSEADECEPCKQKMLVK